MCEAKAGVSAQDIRLENIILHVEMVNSYSCMGTNSTMKAYKGGLLSESIKNGFKIYTSLS